MLCWSIQTANNRPLQPFKKRTARTIYLIIHHTIRRGPSFCKTTPGDDDDGDNDNDDDALSFYDSLSLSLSLSLCV